MSAALHGEDRRGAGRVAPAPTRAPAARGSRPAAPTAYAAATTYLQRQLGNRAYRHAASGERPLVQRCACGGTCADCQAEEKQGAVQTKLTVGPPGDAYEREADHLAERVTAMGAAAPASREPIASRIQRLASAGAGAATTASDASLPSAGARPLSAQTRAFMEPRFGVDFSGVRVHEGAEAAAAADRLEARAFTHGRDIWLGRGADEGDRRLMAHELTHVVQQSGAAGSTTVPAIQRTAASCPTDWRTTVNDDHNRALGMIDTARAKLSAYNGTTPPEVLTALGTHFHATSTAFAGWVNLNLWILRRLAPLAGYDCEDTSSWWCGASTNAKTMWCVPGFDIRVCQPNYFGHVDLERSRILIHEWVHKYGCNFDLGYRNDPGYSTSWTITSLLNADPFAQFVKDVQ